MIHEALAVASHIRKAVHKHPSFPENVVVKHTTYRSLSQRLDSVRLQNDNGRETISSVLDEECAELFCAIYKKRWHKAESELLDVIAVLFRVWKIIKARKRERYNRIASYIRYRRMLRYKYIIQDELFPDMHKSWRIDPVTTSYIHEDEIY